MTVNLPSNIHIALSLGIPIYNLFSSSTIPVQQDKLVRSAPKSLKWQTTRYVRKRGRKRRADHCDLPHHDNTQPGKSPVVQSLPEPSGNRDSVPALKRAKIDTQPTEVMSSHAQSNTGVEGSRIAKISSSHQEEFPSSHTTDREEIPTSHTTDQKEFPASHSSEQIPSHNTDQEEFPGSEQIPSRNTDQEEFPASHSTGIEVSHITDQEEISNLQVLNITDHNGHSNAVLSTSTSENGPGSLHQANEDTTEIEHQHVIPPENVSPGERSLPSRKRPQRQLEEIFEAAVLTRPKRRKRSHCIQMWREGKRGSRGRRWWRWKRQENWKKRWRQKQHSKKHSKSTAFKTGLPGEI